MQNKICIYKASLVSIKSKLRPWLGFEPVDDCFEYLTGSVSSFFTSLFSLREKAL